MYPNMRKPAIHTNILVANIIIRLVCVLRHAPHSYQSVMVIAFSTLSCLPMYFARRYCHNTDNLVDGD
jgi:hypothetical protein